jgi:glycosyltransferase involved in cell wall biosynthesis
MFSNSEEIKVSIIVTCYNLENYIAQAIYSLLHQEGNTTFEIIVVDDASTDASPQIIKSIVDPRLQTIFLTENIGAAQAINTCYARAKGKYICRFDGDDKWHPQYLQKVVEILDQQPEVQLVFTDVAFINERDEVTSAANNIARPPHLKMTDNEFQYILESYYINAPTIIARRTAWDKALPWLEQFKTGLGDWYCSLMMLENGLSCFINEPLAYYRIHSTNMHRAMIKDKSAEKNTQWILNFFKQRTVHFSSLVWKKIFFEQNKHLGFSYFYHEMDKDARRCLGRAVRYHPAALFRVSFLRIFVGSIIGQKSYTRIKKLLAVK